MTGPVDDTYAIDAHVTGASDVAACPTASDAHNIGANIACLSNVIGLAYVIDVHDTGADITCLSDVIGPAYATDAHDMGTYITGLSDMADITSTFYDRGTMDMVWISKPSCRSDIRASYDCTAGSPW